MARSQIKRISLPRTWKVPRKSFQRKKQKFVSRPNAGKELEFTLSINNFIKDVLKLASTKKEVKYMIKFKTVLVNGNKVKDEKFPIGLFDVLELKEAKKIYRLILSSNGKLAAIEIPEKEKDVLVTKVIGKNYTKNGLQLALFNGYNFNVKENEKIECKTGDSLLLKNKEFQKLLELKEGSFLMVVQGRHIGKIGTAKKIDGDVLHMNIGDQELETVKKYAYVLGDKKSEIKILNE